MQHPVTSDITMVTVSPGHYYCLSRELLEALKMHAEASGDRVHLAWRKEGIQQEKEDTQ